MKEKIEKPFILEMEEAKLEIVQAINNAIQEHKMPCYIIDIMLSEITAQIKEGAKNELAMARQQVEEQQSSNEEEVA
jgi:hypothetical protein